MRYVAAVCLVAAGACASPTGPSAPGRGTFSSAHFVFRYTPIDSADIVTTAAAVEREYARILQDLGVDAMPVVHVTFYTDHAALEAATRPVVGIVPSWTAGLVTAEDQIHLMSPSLPAWAPYSRMLGHLVHEFAHGVSMHVNRTIPNRPRWWWESVAIYESGQFVDPRTLPYMTAGTPPSFAELGSIDNTRIYDVGYTIAEFVVSTWGRAAMRSLILTNGDVAQTLGLSQADFEAQWFAFVRARYAAPSSTLSARRCGSLLA